MLDFFLYFRLTEEGSDMGNNPNHRGKVVKRIYFVLSVFFLFPNRTLLVLYIWTFIKSADFTLCFLPQSKKKKTLLLKVKYLNVLSTPLLDRKGPGVIDTRQMGIKVIVPFETCSVAKPKR